MKFLSLKVIPALLLCSTFAPAKVNSSMKDAYKKDQANKASCNVNTANYYDDANYREWNGDRYETFYFKRYYCVLGNGSIMEFSDYKQNKRPATEIGNINKTQLTQPGWNDFTNQMTKGFRTEYSQEGNNLVEYSCSGYYECLSKPERKVLGKKYYPKKISKNTSNNNYYAMYMDKGKKFYQQENYSDAKSYFGQAVSSKKSAEAYLMRGFSNYMLKDYISAIYDFGRVNEITPNNSNAYLYKGLSQILGEEESQNKLEILKGCQNINKAKELGSKAASNFLSKKNLCISLLERN